MGPGVTSEQIAGRLSRTVLDLDQDPWQRTLYVDNNHVRSTDLNNTGLNPGAPLKTLAKAVSLAAHGDVILLAGGQLQILTTTLDINKRVKVIGLSGNRGSNPGRPVISLSGTDVAQTINLHAAGIGLHNLHVRNNLASLTSMITVNSQGGSDCLLEDILISRLSAAVDPVTYITIQNQACTIRRLQTRSVLDAGATQAILLNSNAADDCLIEDCFIEGDFSAACIVVGANTVTRCHILRNMLRNDNAVCKCIDIGAAVSSGVIADNRMRILTDAATSWVAFGAGAIWWMGENYGVNDNNETGKLIGAVSV